MEDKLALTIFVASNNDFDWQWADPDQSSFDMIGQVVVDHQEHDQYNAGIGFLISPRQIMTNAHVVSQELYTSDLSDLNEVGFFRGRNGGELFEEQEGNHFEGEHVYLEKDEWDTMWPDTDMAIFLLSVIPDLIRDPVLYLDSCLRRNDGKRQSSSTGCFAVGLVRLLLTPIGSNPVVSSLLTKSPDILRIF